MKTTTKITAILLALLFSSKLHFSVQQQPSPPTHIELTNMLMTTGRLLSKTPYVMAQ